MISDVEIYVNNHQICFEEKRYKYVFKGQRIPPHHANSKPSTVFVVFFKTKIYIYQERTFFYISQKKDVIMSFRKS